MSIIQPIVWCFSVIAAAAVLTLISAAFDVRRRDEEEQS